MNDKEFEGCKGRVQALLDEWAFGTEGNEPRMSPLKGWIIKAVYRRDSFNTDDGDIAGAHVIPAWHYKVADMEFNCQELLSLPMLELELLVVHELCHLLVNEMREFAGDKQITTGDMHHEEHVVTNLSLAFLQTKYKDMKKAEDDKGTKGRKVGK